MSKQRLLALLRRAIGTQQILDRMNSSRPCSRAENSGPTSIQEGKLTLLEGTRYARFAIPVDYMPSRDYRPRYGYSHPPIRSMETWFASCADDYRAFVHYMQGLDVSHIAHSLEETPVPKPSWIGGAICAFDSLALYAMVRKRRPKCYLEIGSGMTTCFARQAISDGGQATRIVSIDPDPRAEIDDICDEVIRHGLETCDLSIFDRLASGDIVFFDGSHRAFMNSDVTVFFIDVLPRLRPGVLVHVHDINLPYDYPESFKNWYWNEQYMLAVYMMGNHNRISPLLPTAFICRSTLFEEEMRTPFVDLGASNDSWHGGGSMWFTHI